MARIEYNQNFDTQMVRRTDFFFKFRLQYIGTILVPPNSRQHAEHHNIII